MVLLFMMVMVWSCLCCASSEQIMPGQDQNIHSSRIQKRELLHYPPGSYQASTDDVGRRQTSKSPGLSYSERNHLTNGENAIQKSSAGQKFRHNFVTTLENPSLTRNYQTSPPHSDLHVVIHPALNEQHYSNRLSVVPQSTHIAIIPVHISSHRNDLPSRKSHTPYHSHQRQWNMIPEVISLQGQDVVQTRQIYIPYRKQKGRRTHSKDVNYGLNNLEPDFLDRKPEVDNSIASRFGGDENNGISAWGGTARSSYPANSPDIIHFNGKGQRTHSNDVNYGLNNLEPDFLDRKPEVDNSLGSRFGGDENNGISAWGGTARSSSPTNSPDIMHFNGKGQRTHSNDVNYGLNNLEPDFLDRKPEVDNSLASRFGGDANNGISAWGGTARSSYPTNSPDIIHFNGMSGKKFRIEKINAQRN